jgi:hypothetical protein
MTFDLAADCEYHPADPRRGSSTVWFPNGSKAKVPHGAQRQGLEALGVAVARSACEEWARAS